MAVPTISLVTPNSGPTRGRYLVVIDGSNFRLPPAPPPTGPTSGSFLRTVSVQFGGKPAADVQVLTSGKLCCLAAPYQGSADQADPIPSVAVRVANLDNNGVEIPGENVTLASAFTYARQRLDAASHLQYVVRTLVRELKRHVLPNVSVSVSTDYDDEVGDQLDLTYLSQLPALAINGPDLRENREYSLNKGEAIEGAEGFDTPRKPRTVDLLFTMIGAADSVMVLLNLQDAVERYFEANKKLVVDRNPDNPAGGIVDYELWLVGDPSVELAPSNSNVRYFSGAFEVRGYDLEMETELRTQEVTTDPMLETGGLS